MDIFNQLFREKSKSYTDRFNDYIREKSKSLIEQVIQGTLASPADELRQQTNSFIRQHELLDEVEGLKQLALEEFVKQYISSQTAKLSQKPRAKAVQTVKVFIDRIKNRLRADPTYAGHKLEKFKLIPDLLKQIVIYYSCFLVQLPLFEYARELLETIEANPVTTITTSTGSGKNPRISNTV